MELNLETDFIITLADGRQVTGRQKNGTYFVSETELTDEMFANNLVPVTIEENGVTSTYSHATVSPVLRFNESFCKGWGVTILPLAEREVEFQQMKANMDFMAMMGGYTLNNGNAATNQRSRSKYAIVEYYWRNKYWNNEMMRSAVDKGWISKEEYEELTGVHMTESEDF